MESLRFVMQQLQLRKCTYIYKNEKKNDTFNDQ